MSVTVNITSERRAEINPRMTGLFFEDLSHAADGGLYAELIENRSFCHVLPEFEYYLNSAGKRKERLIGVKNAPDYGWHIELGRAEYIDKSGRPFMRLHGSECGAAVVNDAFGGIYCAPERGFKVFVRADAGGYDGEFKAELVKDGSAAASAKLSSRGGDHITAVISGGKTASDCRFRLSLPELSEEEYIDIFSVSVMPGDAVLGIFRRDMVEAMREINPGFLRFPGGCVVEGYCLNNRYRWKDTVGPLDKRKQTWNRWAFKQQDYNQTFGIGFYEYFLLCEYLGCEPLPVINASMACQYNTSETVPLFDEFGGYTAEFMEYVKDALDLIEFANGSPDSEWGAVRAEMGHPEPFNMWLLGIGNEQWVTDSNLWFARYDAFEKFIHEKYPDIDLICSSGPKVEDESYEKAWSWIRRSVRQNPGFAFAVDEHNYNTKEWFFENTGFYDGYDRGVPVYLGEYAVKAYETENGRQYNNMISALAEAAFMCGAERNGDVVRMASYAPLFSKKQPFSHWAPNMIWFDSERIVKTPNYYVQKMFSNNAGKYILNSEADGGLIHSVSMTGSGSIIVKLVNPSPEPVDVRLRFGDWLNVQSRGVKHTLSAPDPEAKNSFENPDNIIPRTEEFTASELLTLEPYSFTILEYVNKE